MQKSVIIVGGGVIGFCTAWHLHRSRWQVTVLDDGNFQDGCSYGSAGYISPSHVIPLSAPGMIGKGLLVSQLLNNLPTSIRLDPFRINRF